jgi:nucleoside-diphosphate-sugar epimerase
MRVLVTGGSGFVGTVVCERLARRGAHVVAAVRTASAAPSSAMSVHAVGDLSAATEWTDALKGVDAVVHLAARTHQVDPGTDADLAAYRRVNVDATGRLARDAAAAGVKRFVFASSIKVNGERTSRAQPPLTGADTPRPEGAYGKTKWEAEQLLAAVARSTGFRLLILRPPLVYGPGNKANFYALLRAIDRGLPLPLAAIQNVRSLVYVENLADALCAAATHTEAEGTYTVADCALSTPDLVRALARALGRPARLVHCPPALLRWSARVVGRAAMVRRLTDSLVVDATAVSAALGWSPLVPLADGMARTAAWYRELHR